VVVRWMKVLGMLGLLLWSGISQACDIEIKDARLRLPPPMADTAAAYMVLQNGCAHERVLRSVSSPWAKMVMLHDAAMHKMPKLVLKAGQSFAFQPREAHIMLMGVGRVMTAGTHVPLVLHWQDGRVQTVDAVVQDMRQMGQGE